MQNLIYGLVDPHTKQLRYVGKTSHGQKRLEQHLKPSSLRTRTHKNHWLRSLLNSGLRPEFVVIHELDTDELLSRAEVFWIRYFKELGYPLTNSTAGGEGPPMGVSYSVTPRFSTDDFLNRYLAEGYSVLESPLVVKSKSRVKLRCTRSHVYISNPNKWALGRRCQYCSTPRAFERNDWKGLLAALDGFLVTYQGTGRNRRLIGTCPRGHSLDVDARRLLRNPDKLCPSCSHDSRARLEAAENLGEIRELATIDGYSVSVPVTYRNSHDRLDFTCSRGHSYSASAYSFKAGKRCRRCSNSHGP